MQLSVITPGFKVNLKKINKAIQKIYLNNCKLIKISVLVLVFLFTFILRAHNYDRVPTANHLDEMQFAWAGLYLIETGTPVSWSTLEYPKSAEVFKGMISYKGGIPQASVTLYQPWLDHPPLFSLIVGSFAHLYHADRTQFVPSSYIRMPVIFFAAVTSIFIFLIARIASGFWTGVLAMLVYGTTPLFIFASRTAMSENLIAMLLAIMIYIFLKFLPNPKFWLLLPIPLMIGIAGLSKTTGFLLLPLAIYLTFLGYFRRRQINLAIKSVVFLILGTIPFIGLFFWYGISLNPDIFWRVLDIQSHRPVGFGSLAWFFITPSYDIVVLRDSFFVFCLLSAAYFIFSTKYRLNQFKEKSDFVQIIILTFIYWVGIVMISGGENDLLAWYRFGAYPALAIIGSWGLLYLVKKADLFSSFLAAGLLLGNRMLLANAFRDNIQPMQYRAIFGLLMLPSILDSIFEKLNFKKLTQIAIICTIIVGIYFNVIFVYNAFEITCESLTCPIVPSTWLSTMHYPFIWRFLDLGTPDRY